MRTKYYHVVPSMLGSNVIWPQVLVPSPVFYRFGFKTITINVGISYKVMTSVTATAIMEWNVGQPLSSQIRQTSFDRLDFAY